MSWAASSSVLTSPVRVSQHHPRACLVRGSGTGHRSRRGRFGSGHVELPESILLSSSRRTHGPMTSTCAPCRLRETRCPVAGLRWASGLGESATSTTTPAKCSCWRIRGRAYATAWRADTFRGWLPGRVRVRDRRQHSCPDARASPAGVTADDEALAYFARSARELTDTNQRELETCVFDRRFFSETLSTRRAGGLGIQALRDAGTFESKAPVVRTTEFGDRKIACWCARTARARIWLPTSRTTRQAARMRPHDRHSWCDHHGYKSAQAMLPRGLLPTRLSTRYAAVSW